MSNADPTGKGLRRLARSYRKRNRRKALKELFRRAIDLDGPGFEIMRRSPR